MKYVNNKIYLDWNDIHEFIDRIVNHIKQTLKNPSSFEIVTIPRGGLIPSTLLAYKLNIKNIHFIEFKDNNSADMKKIPLGKRLLFIDDIYDSGVSYEIVRHLLFDYDFKPCYLIMKNAPTNIPQPFYVGRTLFNEWRYVVFPWENDKYVLQ